MQVIRTCTFKSLYIIVPKRHISLSTDYFYDQSVEKWAAKEANRKSLKEYCSWGKVKNSRRKVIISARYVQKELGIRLARELQNFHELPYKVMCSPHVRKVFDMYLNAFRKLTGIPEIDSDELEVEFSKTLEGLVHSYTGIVDLLAHGIYEASHLNRVTESVNVQQFLDRFIINRIARRVLAEQHLVLRSSPKDQDKVGVISAQCEIMKCIEEAKRMINEDTERNYTDYPDIIVKGDTTAAIPYLEQHLIYILVELFSNSVNAVVKVHKENNLPPIQVLIANGDKKITLRISDCGGGIPPLCINKIFEYGWTTAKTPKERIRTDPMGMKGVTVEPVGLGFGLPLARLYAKHFGGNLTLVSLDGFGTDAFLTLDKTGDVLENFEL